MTKAILLDGGPLGLLTHTKMLDQAVRCAAWLRLQIAAGTVVIVPEIADYEITRELLRLGATKGLFKLDSLVTVPGIEYLPITTHVMRNAAALWAEARRLGRPTADPTALDADVILAAQAIAVTEVERHAVVATTNIGHLARFVSAEIWSEIGP